MWACMMPSPNAKMMLDEPGPRSSHGVSSTAARSGTKLVFPGVVAGFDHVQVAAAVVEIVRPVRSLNSKPALKMLLVVVEDLHHHRCGRGRAQAAPVGFRCRLKCRYLALSGMAKKLRGPHSKLRLLPSPNSSCVLPRPSSTK